MRSDIELYLVVDNEASSPKFSKAWGLSVYGRVGSTSFLMDVSGSFSVFDNNVNLLGLASKVGEVDFVFISHWHGDHSGALEDVLTAYAIAAPVYVPSPPPRRVRAEVAVAERPLRIADHAYSTGCMNGVKEHSLVLSCERGFVLVVGCCHPGVPRIVERAESLTGEEPYAILGGMHLTSYGEGLAIGEYLRGKGFEVVAPCHCTGKSAKLGLKKALGDAFVEVGAGSALKF